MKMLENDENGKNPDCKQNSEKENVEAVSEIHDIPMLDLKCDSEEPISVIPNGNGELNNETESTAEKEPPLTNGFGKPNGTTEENHEDENAILEKDSSLNEHHDKLIDEQKPKQEVEDDEPKLKAENEAEPANLTEEDKEADFQPGQSENHEQENLLTETPQPATPPPEISSTTQSSSDPTPDEGEPSALELLLKDCSPKKLKEIQKLINEKISQASVAKADPVVIEPQQEEVPEVPCALRSLTDQPETISEPMIVDEEVTAMNSQLATDAVEKTTRKRSCSYKQSTSKEPVECIVLTDSDDEPQPSKKSKPDSTVDHLLPSSSLPESINTAAIGENSSTRQQSQPEKLKAPPKRKECANTSCLHSETVFERAPIFLLNILSIPLKKTPQYLCRRCFDESISIIEGAAESLQINLPLELMNFKPKQADAVQVVIDSDDDDEESTSLSVPDEDKIIFDKEVEDEVEDLILNLYQKYKIPAMTIHSLEISHQKLDKMDTKYVQADKDIKMLDRKSMVLYNEVYSINKPTLKHRAPLEIDEKGETVEIHHLNNSIVQIQKNTNDKSSALMIALKNVVAGSKSAPQLLTPVSKSISPIAASSSSSSDAIPSTSTTSTHTPIYFALKSCAPNRMQNWALCKMINDEFRNGKKCYRIQFDRDAQIVTVSGKEIAKNEVNLSLRVGARVLALFARYDKFTGLQMARKYYPGVIGERLTKDNKQRYLVFSDYGEAQYVEAKDVKEVFEYSTEVWEDVHVNLQKFIKDYLQIQSCRRPLISTDPGKHFQIQRDGNWLVPDVVEVDCSLVLLRYKYQEKNIFEWVYRGSKRLSTILRLTSTTTGRRHGDANVCYAIIDEEGEAESLRQSDDTENNQQMREPRARKSTSSRSHQQQQVQTQKKAPFILNDPMIYIDDPKDVARVRHYMPRKDLCPDKFEPHTCSPKCLKASKQVSIYGPLAKPLVSSWEREITRFLARKSEVVYRAPCGRRIRNMYEIRDYLRITNCPFTVENFNFDVEIQVLALFQVNNPKECPLYIEDITEGKEGIKIPAINAFDDRGPPEMKYTAVRKPVGFKINTDPAFMACCDCEDDDCANKDTCACFQMTINSYLYANRNDRQESGPISYEWKRLLSQVSSGIYECHSGCKCNSRCLNKVVQHPIRVRMQMFRTKLKGWGLQACHDIPRGSFICVYAGKLYRDEDTETLCQGVTHGDEYFAELDLIESLAPQKEDFESGVTYPDQESSDDDEIERDDEEDIDFEGRAGGSSEQNRRRSSRNQRNRASARKSIANNAEDGDNDEIMPSQDNFNMEAPKSAAEAFRQLHGENTSYIMDAKHEGNIGRYFNHSCDPNLVVQNVFVDTHDMRFPWIAFFASRNIKAGEELTWNYNYTVGDVPSKVLYCKCGAANCKKRIL